MLKLALAKSWGFFFGCQDNKKQVKTRLQKTATSRINTGFRQKSDRVYIPYTYPMHTVSILYTYRIHTVYAKKKEKKKAERKEQKERVKNKEK